MTKSKEWRDYWAMSQGFEDEAFVLARAGVLLESFTNSEPVDSSVYAYG